MIDSVIWWRAITPSRPKQLGLGFVMLSGLIAGCGAEPEAATPLPDLDTAPISQVDPEPPIPVAPPASLTPLPTSEQVQGSVSRGRVDPFAPLASLDAPSGGSASGSSGQQPAGSISLQGVMAVGDQLQALIRIGAGSGPVCLGSRGQCASDQVPLLPKQWSVLKIDLQRGCLTYAVEGKAQPPVCMASPKA